MSVAAAAQRPVNLTEMTLEELLTVEITSAGKKAQLLRETAAAIYVITAEDIRRSQATTLPELLRQVPGLHVAREGTANWAIGIRGFNGSRANKLLVLMDGRTLYTPIYTGVDWNMQDTLLEDIERIEIVRGPGASVWGANAVNGIINIITKPAADTQGGVVMYDGGPRDGSTLNARYGGSLRGDQLQYRVFSKAFARKHLLDEDGNSPPGGWKGIRQGGRLDYAVTPRDDLSLTGEWSLTGMEDTVQEVTSLTAPFRSIVTEHDRTVAAFVTTEWRRQNGASEFGVRFFYDRNHQYERSGHDRNELVDTADVELTHRRRAWGRHDLVSGGGVRVVRDSIRPALDGWFAPDRRTALTYNGFVQDEIALFDAQLRVTIGSKFEWNDFSGAEVQPTARLAWIASPRHSFWAAASRAVRVPSREDVARYSISGLRVRNNQTTYRLRSGNADFQPETVVAYEAGYRLTPAASLSIDLTSFYNAYDGLETSERGVPFSSLAPIPGLVTPVHRRNGAYGATHGAEAAVFWTARDAVRFTATYSFLQMRMAVRPGSTYRSEEYEDDHPRHMFSLRSDADLPWDLEINGGLRLVDRIPDEEVPRYLDGDVRVSRPIVAGLRLGVSLENLLHRRRIEWDDDALVPSRSIRARFEWRF